MIATQYKITLPSDYDMNIIKERVRNNGYKTDGFEDLKFKLYLVTEKGMNNNLQNSYCPLYLWKDTNGLNKFLFNGFYDNILNSFGWQRVNVGIPLIDTTTPKIKEKKYLFQITREIQPQESLNNLKDKLVEDMPEIDHTEYIVIYNPDKWKYDVFYFLSDLSVLGEMSGVIYHILHISQEELANQ
ncbi:MULTISPECIES: DUF4865 family protein [unclassified Bacillus (in: firmicutes)]|uniref:DUF4865 family protein n=1 Tax=unclassified Bacillus (in: firmicutes) TaxID=185979 RepID=UPI0008ED1720|nr:MULTISPECIES: DUF4865 family protein [unclassified Bacillus (in: firmicutes)]SFA70010.1 protein of unknown function [Bacillus sp. UNCCL13]SFQ59472.1 protein of unknown function [Bacillus sp. cl95]